jgi:hypothetical protein
MMMRTVVDVTTGEVTIDPDWDPGPPAPPPVPKSVTRRQLKLWLVRNRVPLAQVEAAINTLPEPQRAEAMIEWQDATVFERENPLLGRLAALVLRVSDKELDAALDRAFREAATY